MVALQVDRTWLSLVAVKSATGNPRNRLPVDDSFAIEMHGDGTTDQGNVVFLPLAMRLEALTDGVRKP